MSNFLVIRMKFKDSKYEYLGNITFVMNDLQAKIVSFYSRNPGCGSERTMFYKTCSVFG